MLGIALFPTATLIILAFAGEKLTLRKGVRLLLVMIGLYCLIGISGEFNLRGLLFVVIAGVSYGLHLATVQWYMQPYNTWATTGVMMGGGAIIVTLFVAVQRCAIGCSGLARMVCSCLSGGSVDIYRPNYSLRRHRPYRQRPICTAVTCRNSADHHLVAALFRRTSDTAPMAWRRLHFI